MPEPSPVPAAERPREVIHCAKCDTENLAGATRCHECGAHLYLGCPVCGAGNLRSLRTCAKCGARLGRGRLRRLKDKLFRRFSVFETLAGVAVLGVLLWLLLRLAMSGGLPGTGENGADPTHGKPPPEQEQAKPDEDPEPE